MATWRKLYSASPWHQFWVTFNDQNGRVTRVEGINLSRDRDVHIVITDDVTRQSVEDILLAGTDFDRAASYKPSAIGDPEYVGENLYRGFQVTVRARTV